MQAQQNFFYYFFYADVFYNCSTIENRNSKNFRSNYTRKHFSYESLNVLVWFNEQQPYFVELLR